MARKIEIDLAKVESLAAQGLTHGQIADALGISARTLHSRKAYSAEFALAIKRGKAKGVGVVANALFQQAKNGNTTAMIFYLKARAGWSDRPSFEESSESLADSLATLIEKLPG